MTTTTLVAPIRENTAGVHARPGLGRLVAVELRKMVDTRAGFWLQVAMVALTVVVVVLRLLVGDRADHLDNAMLVNGDRDRCTPPASAASLSRSRRLWQARCRATNDDEHAVSTVIAGPCNPNV